MRCRENFRVCVKKKKKCVEKNCILKAADDCNQKNRNHGATYMVQ